MISPQLSTKLQKQQLQYGKYQEKLYKIRSFNILV